MAKRVYIAGHRGMVGSALVRRLKQEEDIELLVSDRNEVDLTCQQAVDNFFAQYKPDEVYLAAAKVGGIHANNQYPAEFIYENLMIEANIIHCAYRYQASKLLFLGSSCIYPRLADQPIKENALLTGPLEPTNEPYAVAKIAGIKLCESYARQYGCDFRSLMPTNLYGPGDNFHPLNAHVMPALIRRFHEAVENRAPEVVIWGSGSPRREFLHVDDLADACVFVMNLSQMEYQAHTDPMISHINVGTGKDVSIRELAELIADITDYQGELRFDQSKPDGTPRKLLDVQKLQALGWKSSVRFADGVRSTYDWFVQNYHALRG